MDKAQNLKKANAISFVVQILFASLGKPIYRAFRFTKICVSQAENETRSQRKQNQDQPPLYFCDMLFDSSHRSQSVTSFYLFTTQD